MNIVKHGAGTLSAIVRRFECSACGCVFDAAPGEYDMEWDVQIGRSVSVCECPECRRHAYHGIPLRKEGDGNG